MKKLLVVVFIAAAHTARQRVQGDRPRAFRACLGDEGVELSKQLWQVRSLAAEVRDVVDHEER